MLGLQTSLGIDEAVDYILGFKGEKYDQGKYDILRENQQLVKGWGKIVSTHEKHTMSMKQSRLTTMKNRKLESMQVAGSMQEVSMQDDYKDFSF